MGMIADALSSILAFATAHPSITSVLTSGAVLAAVWGALLAYWKRPIIRAWLGDKAGSHGPVPIDFNDRQGNLVLRKQAKYFRLRIQNGGRTTIKDCSGHLIGVTRHVGRQVTPPFDTEVHSLGWANYPESKKRDIPRGGFFHLDVATLLISNAGSSLFWQDVPNTLVAFFESFPGKATYTFKVRIDADNSRQRTIPVQFTFDPERPYLDYVPLNTRYPWWRLVWWLRARRACRRAWPAAN